ncbi:CAP domain-containing protein [Streptomyces sp. NPDC056160]|uniref:CAP domain-containing protein n=1 Tax=Streptomyces sp. NPDC056160 TaxID=3345731 RepID=UPI0035DE1D6D
MGKHRKHQHHRRIAIAAVAVGAVGIPSAALACGGWPGSGSHPSHGVARRTTPVQWNPAAWDDSGARAGSGERTPAASPTASARTSTPRPTVTAPGTRSPRTTAPPRPRSTPARHTVGPLSSSATWKATATAAPSTAAASTPARPHTTPAATASTTPAPAASSSPQTGATASTAVVARVLELVNAQRAQAGCSALTANPTLAEAAQAHSEDMAAHQNMSHTGSDGSAPGDRITRAGYVWSTYGENVAYGYSTPEKVMAAWMASPGHKANILNCSFKEIGVGLAQPGAYWTQDFATSR